jgi:acyl carrier protein
LQIDARYNSRRLGAVYFAIFLGGYGVIESVKRILRDTLQLGNRADKLDEHSGLLGELPELDSMAVVTILTLFEEEFGIEVNDDDISAETFATVGSLAKFLEERV